MSSALAVRISKRRKKANGHHPSARGRKQAAKIEAQRQLPEFQPGDTVRVLVRVTEGTRTRVQAYEGVCIARSGSGLQENFTVRKIFLWRGRGARVPRSIRRWSRASRSCGRGARFAAPKLYYLRDRRGKSARDRRKHPACARAS